MALEILRPWNGQPNGIARLDRSNDLTRGLVALHSGGSDLLNLSSGAQWTNNGTLLVPGRAGLARQYVSGSSQYLSTAAAVQYPLTMFALARQTTTGVDRAIISVGAATANRHLLYITGADLLAVFSGTGAVQWTSGASTYTNTTDYAMYVGIVRSSANRQGYVNGSSPNAANVGSDVVSVSSTVAVGAYWNSGGPTAGFYWPGDIALAGVYNRALSDEEIKALYQNPWQLFEPRRIWVPVSAGGGGGGFQAAWARNRNSVIGAGVLR